MAGKRESRLIEVRATIHLPGLPLGAVTLVDPSDDYIAEALAARHLVPTTTSK